MKPVDAPTVFGLSSTRMSPPRRRLGGVSRTATFRTARAAPPSPISAPPRRLPLVEGERHGVLGLAPVRVVRADVLGQFGVDVPVQRMAARPVEAIGHVFGGLRPVTVEIMASEERPSG